MAHVEFAQLFTGLILALLGATLLASALRRWWPAAAGGQNIIVETLFARINAWWAMVVLLSFAAFFGRLGIVVLFLLVSFSALREFLTLTRKRRADHWAMMFSFFIALPLQYLLVYIGSVGLFTIFIPVYTFLFLPVLAVIRGDTSGFLSRVAETQWALMLTIFAASHAPALLLLEIDGYEGKQILLIAWLVIVVQAADIAHYIVPRLMGRTRIAPSLPHSRTWEGFLGALGAGAIIGTALSWVTPFAPWQAAIMAIVVAVLGYAGGMVMAAIKRDKGVVDWSHLIPGQGGFIDRLDSVVFSAPLFFHLVRYFWT
ncbi:phosphatidate cytidylyltransferase [Sinisalibacter aestuarii]|uniref:Phosphatidate cytidylyltransferase n=1 Tax=Sinisalibacter aestuarii TaxID=2949426 RepID=A0ABQ5LNB9_9RHOB|nr:phosphatidate cytidylyltransferase [Sinisalibacter aestuarii]GKY86278.1 phosphatidate cytidylyltransferase [Sinisalibacter aestuarii]